MVKQAALRFLPALLLARAFLAKDSRGNGLLLLGLGFASVAVLCAFALSMGGINLKLTELEEVRTNTQRKAAKLAKPGRVLSLDDDLTAFHDKHDVLEGGDVCYRIPAHRDDIRESPRLNRTHSIGPAQ